MITCENHIQIIKILFPQKKLTMYINRAQAQYEQEAKVSCSEIHICNKLTQGLDVTILFGIRQHRNMI